MLSQQDHVIKVTKELLTIRIHRRNASTITQLNSKVGCNQEPQTGDESTSVVSGTEINTVMLLCRSFWQTWL
jgi:hypothetical protein